MPDAPKHRRIAWIALALLFLVPRLAIVAIDLGRPLRGDEVSYDQIARNVTAGHGFASGQDDEPRVATAARGPAYVLLIAAFDRLFGPDRTPLFLFQVFLDALCLLLVFELARRWFGSWWVAWGAAALYATYPVMVLDATSLLTETLAQFALLVWVRWFWRYLDERRLGDLAIAAVALGVCALSKPHLVLFGPVTLLAAAPLLGTRAAARTLVTVVAVTTLVMSPWIVRNALVFRAFVPGVSIGGLGLLFGSGGFGGYTVGSLQHRAVPDSVRTIVGGLSEVDASRWATRQTIAIVREDPAAYAKLSLAKVPRLWLNLGFDDPPSRSSLLLAAFNVAVLALAVLGIRAAKDRAAVNLLLAGALFWTLVHVPFVANVRYVAPFLALVFPFAAAGAGMLARGFRGRRRV